MLARHLSCALLALAACAAASTPAQAAFPGENGKIAFQNLEPIDPAQVISGKEIYVMNPDGTGQTDLTNNGISDSDPAWSPNGQKIAFTSERDSVEEQTRVEIYVMNADGSSVVRVTDNNAVVDSQPAWSPDGTKIAFTTQRDGNDEVYVMNADGSGQTNLSNNAADDSEAAWSPDGQKIAFRSGRDGNAEVYVMNADGSGQTNLTNNPAPDSQPNWSPDSGKLAFTTSRDGNLEIYAMNANGTGPTRLTNDAASDFEPAWSPDGAKIAFSSRRDGVVNDNVYVMNADGTVPTRFTNNPSPDLQPDWQPKPATPCPDVPVGFATAKGCFTETASGIFETQAKAWVGGFEIQPRPDGKLVLDTNNPGLSEGGAGADIVFRGRALPLPVAALPVGLTGATIPFGQAGTLGFLFDVPVKGSVAVAWAENGTASSFEAEIEIRELTKGIGEPDPSTLGGGKLKAKLENGTGFKLEEFEVKIDEISVTPARMVVPRQLKLKNLLLKMELRTDAAMVEKPFWTGQAGITLPLTRGELDVLGRAFIFDGDLAGGGFEVDGINKPIPDTPLFLQKVGGDLLFQPRFGFTLLIGGSLGPRVRGQLLMDIDGTMQGGELVSGCEAGTDPSKLEFTSKLTPLAVLEANGVAKADLTFRSCIYTGTASAMELTGEGKIDFLGGLLGYEGSQTGFISTRGANLEGAVKLRIPTLPDLNGKAIVSTKGIGACADLTFFQGGFGIIFGSLVPPGTFSGCDLAPFRVTASAASLRGRAAAATRVPAGLPHAAFAAKSRRGAPRVRVTGPGGFKATSPAGGRALRSRRVVIVHSQAEKTTYVVVNDPRAGAWRVESLERRKPLTRVSMARGLAKPKVKAKLRKRGRRMVLTYTLRAMPGQKVTFNELGAGVARSIGRARGRKGTITFTPTRGTPTRRTIKAEVVQNGLPRAMITVARFRASP